MLIIILTVLVLLVGIGLILFACRQCVKLAKEYNYSKVYYDIDEYASGIFGMFTTILGGIAILIELIFLSCTRLPISEAQYYEDMVDKREILVYRLEHEDAVLNGNSYLYEDILNFNSKLRSYKIWSDNIWVGLFYNQKIQDLDYIELGETENDIKESN